MPSITIPALNDLSAFQSIIQDENVSEAKRVLIETVTQMSARRWSRRLFSSNYRAMKHKAKSDLLAALNASSSMDEIKQALRHYKQQFNDVHRQIKPGGNTSAFMRIIGLLVEQPSYQEKVSKADNELMKLPIRKIEVSQQELEQKSPLFFGISATPCPPANIHVIIRTDIINAMKKTGYHPSKKGMCYGVVWTALLACVRQDGQAYMKRMQYLKQMDIPPQPGVDDTHQIYPFFDAVTLSMTNYTDMKGYEKGIGYSGRQEVAFPGRVIGGNEPGYQVPEVKHTFITECTPETLIQFLQQTRKNNKEIPFGMMIHYRGHSVSIGFDGSKWLAANHDNYYYTETIDLLYTFLGEQCYLHKDGRIIAMAEMVSGNGYSLDINTDALVIDVQKSMSVPLALHLALRCGYVNVISDCITVICQQAHTPETLFELLTCKDDIGTPGFFMALENLHTDAITAFIKASAATIATLPLTEDQKAELLYRLLVSEESDGTPGFFMTFQNDYPDAITAFIQESAVAIITLSLPEKQKAKLLCELLASKAADGTPGFYMALQDNHPRVITAFIRASASAIARLSLPKAEKINRLCELLASKRVDEIPGFYMTLRNGHSDAIAAFIQTSAAVITALPLLETQKAKLLCKLLNGKAADGTPGFYMALQQGYPDAITVFIHESTEVIAKLFLSEELKAVLLYELLASRKANGTPGFFIALQRGHTKTITAFIQASAAAIASLSLPETEKAKLLCELLASKNANGTPGFCMTLLNGYSDAITAFIQTSAAVISALHLPEERKAELLHGLLLSKTANSVPGLFVILQKDCPDSIAAFIQTSATVITALDLPEERKAGLLHGLLLSKRGDGLPGFFMTLQKGYSNAITTFIQESAAAIAKLSLPGIEKAKWLCELLVSKGKCGMMGFFMTLYHGHFGAITAFIQASCVALTMFSESEKERAELLYRLFLRIESDNKSSFLLALKQGGAAVNKVFTEGIDQLPLFAEQKKILKYPCSTSDVVENTVAVNQ